MDWCCREVLDDGDARTIFILEYNNAFLDLESEPVQVARKCIRLRFTDGVFDGKIK